MELTYIIQKSRRRSILVTVQPDNKVLVKAPYLTTERTIRDYLLAKKEWITKQIEKQNKENEQARELGFISEDELKKIRRIAKKEISERVAYWAEKIGVSYGRISIRLQTSRWGSCAQNGNLNFNCLLVIMPKEVLDSIVVHELCHRKHMNHSKEFYEEIYRVFPGYESCNKWLKDNGGVYIKRVIAKI